MIPNKFNICIYRLPSCKHSHEYSIKLDDTCTKISNNFKPNNDIFDEEIFDFDVPKPSIEPKISKELCDKINEYGDEPDEYQMREIYNLIRDNVKSFSLDVQKSKYQSEIKMLDDQIGECTKITINDKPYVAWYMEVLNNIVSFTYPDLFLLHIFKNDLGCGCFNSSYPVAIFTDESKAKNLLYKFNNVHHSEKIQEQVENDQLWSITNAIIDKFIWTDGEYKIAK